MTEEVEEEVEVEEWWRRCRWCWRWRWLGVKHSVCLSNHCTRLGVLTGSVVSEQKHLVKVVKVSVCLSLCLSLDLSPSLSFSLMFNLELRR